MFYINRKNLYIRILISILIITSTGLAFLGGIDYVNAQIPGAETPSDPYSKVNPVTKDSIRAHVLAVSTNPEYTVRYEENVWTSNLVESVEIVSKVSNEDRIGYRRKHSQSDIDGTSELVEYYETEEMVYEWKGENVKRTNKSKDENYNSPILKNQFIINSFGLDTFMPFKWTLSHTTDTSYVYTLARADAVAVDHIHTIDKAKGTLKINKENGYISSIEVHVWGSSKAYPIETVYVKYSYTVQLESDITEPNWIDG